jgi:hypothetical protein
MRSLHPPRIVTANTVYRASVPWWPGYYDYAPGQFGRGRHRYGGYGSDNSTKIGEPHNAPKRDPSSFVRPDDKSNILTTTFTIPTKTEIPQSSQLNDEAKKTEISPSSQLNDEAKKTEISPSSQFNDEAKKTEISPSSELDDESVIKKACLVVWQVPALYHARSKRRDESADRASNAGPCTGQCRTHRHRRAWDRLIEYLIKLPPLPSND